MRFSSWTPALLPRLVRFWNRCFAARRNFIPVTEQFFRDRVIAKASAYEKFDPRGFIVALDGQEIAGFIHVGVRPEPLCRLLDPEWRRGTQGYVAFLFVEPALRRRGVGTELWHRGLERLRGSRQVVLDGQCLSPFYGNSEGPFTPFWGTPEGVGVEWDDSPTKKFLARKGFAPRFKGVQLGLDLGSSTATADHAARAAARQGFEFRVLENCYPELGKNAKERRPLLPGLTYEVVAAVRRGKVAGLVSFYPMTEARAGLFGIYEATVTEALRGRALGRRLLEAAIGRMRERGAAQCEVLTLPELSPAAHKVYMAAGFQRVQNWAIY